MYEELSQKTLPEFPMAAPHLFSDYGFDPEIDYFQLQQKVMEEQQRRKRGGKREARKAAAEAVRFKLQKPISKDHSSSSSGNKGKKRAKWWKNWIQFLKSKWAAARAVDVRDSSLTTTKEARISYEGPAAAATNPALPVPTHPPLYTVEGSSRYCAPCRTATKRRVGPCLWSPLKVTEMMPYHSLRDLVLFDDDSGGKDHRGHRLSDAPSSHMPIYLVT